MNTGETSEFDSFDEFEQRRIKNIISGIKKSSSFSGNPFEKSDNHLRWWVGRRLFTNELGDAESLQKIWKIEQWRIKGS